MIKNWLRIILILTFFISISVYVNFKSENIPDPDSLYHIRHAWIYQTNGIFDSSFPWTQFSAIRIIGADLWYGFHVLLIPFTYISDLAVAIKIAAIFITFLVLASFYVALKNMDIKYSELWAIFFLFSSPAIITRMTMTRPHPLSLGLTALIFSFFYPAPSLSLPAGRQALDRHSEKGRAWYGTSSAILVLIFSFLLSWVHSSIFWFPIIVICTIVFFQWLNNQKVDAQKFIAFILGIAGGLIARPHQIGRAHV